MIDTFRLMHGEFVHDKRLAVISEKGFRSANLLTHFIFDPSEFLGREFIEDTNQPEDYANFFPLVIARELRSFGSVPLLEKTFFEIVLMNKLQAMYPHESGPNNFVRNLPHITLGAMIQRRLTTLLVQLSPSCRSMIYKFGTSDGLNRRAWETAITGASSSARVIKAATEIRDVHIYLSTLEEDVTQGIDLFLTIENGTRLCISIKSEIMDQSMKAELVEVAPAQTSNENGKDRRKIFLGTQWINQSRLLDKRFTACIIHVGRPPSRAFDLDLYGDDIDCLRTMLDLRSSLSSRVIRS